MSLNKQCNRKVAELKASLISYVPKKKKKKELKASLIGRFKKIVPEEKSVSLPEVEAVPEKKKSVSARKDQPSVRFWLLKHTRFICLITQA